MEGLYDNVKRNEESTIGYKGGHFERDLLKQLKIPSVNLEDFTCPKAEFLFNKLIWLETCAQHIDTTVPTLPESGSRSFCRLVKRRKDVKKKQKPVLLRTIKC